MKLRIGEASFEAEPGRDGVRVRGAAGATEWRCERLADGRVRVSAEGRSFVVWVEGHRAGTGGEAVTITRELPRAGHDQGGALSPPIPATVGRILVNEGDEVTAGQPLLVLVAMKTELTLRAPHAGKVVGLRATVGQSVRPGDRLVQVDA